MYLKSVDIPVLEPSGTIGIKQKRLIVVAILLSLVVVIPVYVMLIIFSLRYRESSKTARYDPSFTHSRLLEGIWWAVPLAIITILSVIAFRSSHELDPYKPLDSRPAMKIQAVSLQWKWLFIYPDEGIASVNFVKFPSNTPIDFEITSDAPMNSFWIPKLGGQVYAMSGMRTHLNLDAIKPGSFVGLSANISGKGFSGMRFVADSAAQADYIQWANAATQAPDTLNEKTYGHLAKPSTNVDKKLFGKVEPGIFDGIVNKYMAPPKLVPMEGIL